VDLSEAEIWAANEPVLREDEADSKLRSNSGFVRGPDLGCRPAGLPFITTVN
jgi:hypothetical protein